MTEKNKELLKRVGKGVAYAALTFGAYHLAKGTLNIIVNSMDPKRTKKDGQWRTVSKK